MTDRQKSIQNMLEWIAEINQYIDERVKCNIVAIYEQLKDTYPVHLTMEPCFDYEIPVLRGESSVGKFELWDNGLDIIFEVYKPDGTNHHWHPADENETVEAVVSFMQGIYCTIHNMMLHAAPFEKIKSGEKTIELRLYDEKRQQIKVGDKIVFTNNTTGETLTKTVVKLHRFDSFEELYKALPLLKCGYTPEDVNNAHPSDMEQYYSVEEQKKYGVVGIELC